MAEYRIATRGAGFAKAIADGFYDETYFLELFDYCPERLLTCQQRDELRHFLLSVPRLHARRTKEQRRQALELAALLGPLSEDAIDPEARELLLKRVAGATIQRPHRPAHQMNRDRYDCILMAKWIKQSVEQSIRDGQPLHVPWWGMVEEDPLCSHLSIARRALLIADKALRKRDVIPPSDATLQNSMSKIPDLRHLIVKAREEEQG